MKRIIWYAIYLVLLQSILPAGGSSQERVPYIPVEPDYPLEELRLEEPITILLPDLGIRPYLDTDRSALLTDVSQLIQSGSTADYVSDSVLVLFPRSYTPLDFDVLNPRNDHLVAAGDEETLYYLSTSRIGDEENRIYRIEPSTGAVTALDLDAPVFLSLYRGVPYAWFEQGFGTQDLSTYSQRSVESAHPQVSRGPNDISSFFMRFRPRVSGEYMYVIDAAFGVSPLETRIMKLPVFDATSPIVEYHFTNPGVRIDEPTRYPLRDIYSDGDSVIWADINSNVYILDEESRSVRSYLLRFESSVGGSPVPPFDPLLPAFYHHDSGRLLVYFPSSPVFYSEDQTEAHQISMLYDIDLQTPRLVRLAFLVDCGLDALRFIPSSNELAGLETVFAIRFEDQSNRGKIQTWNWTW